MIISKDKQKGLHFPLNFQKQLFEQRSKEAQQAFESCFYDSQEDVDYICSRFHDVIYEADTKFYLFRQSAIDIASRLKFESEKFDASFLSIIPNGKKVTFLLGDIFYRWHKMENDIMVMGAYYDKIEKNKKTDLRWYFFSINLKEDTYTFPPNPVEPFNQNSWVYFMKLILFTELSELEIVTLAPKQSIGTKKQGKYKNESDSNVIIVDSSWNKVLIRENGFLVSGHPRLQSFGEKNKYRKYVWIDTYQKSGYVRNPKMLIEEEKFEKESAEI